MARAREPLVDALRALALVGVLIVNAAGYRAAPEGRLLGELSAQDGWASHTLVALIAAFVQGKAYPLLSALFGMGLVYAGRGLDAAGALAASRRRARRLLVLGLLHGALLYFGDILTLYAICGWLVARHVREPWGRFKRRLRHALIGAMLVCAVGLAVVLAARGFGGPRMAPTIGGVAGWGEYSRLNASTYASAQLMGFVFLLPIVRLCMLAGIAAARLRLLTHRRWRSALERHRRMHLAPLLALNAAYGLAYMAVPGQRVDWQLGLEALNPLWTLPLAALYAVCAALAWHRGARGWVEPLRVLGQHTLSLYLTASLLMLLLYSGAGLAWPAGPWGMLAFALLLWSLAWGASHRWPGRWPLEAWLARGR